MMETVKKEISKRLEELSKEFYENVIPPLDIYENEGFLYIIADLPGFSKDSIKVRLLGENYLQIIAEREVKLKEPSTYHNAQQE